MNAEASSFVLTFSNPSPFFFSFLFFFLFRRPVSQFISSAEKKSTHQHQRDFAYPTYQNRRDFIYMTILRTDFAYQNLVCTCDECVNHAHITFAEHAHTQHEHVRGSHGRRGEYWGR